MLATVLELLKKETRAGLTPKDMSAIAKKELARLGGEPAFLGFYGYPDIICISVNNQVQHSIPNEIPFKDGDVVNYDFGVKYQGMVTDSGITVCVGDKLTPETKRLLTGTERALYDGIRMVKAGARVGDISAAIERTLRKNKLGIVRELVGHGVGHELHEDPEIPNYGHAGRGPILRAGMTIAIEPITTLGDPGIYQARDGWTLLSQDGSWSAQFEHTLLVTPTGCEILTSL
jgi:methionyl aminopeptidase